MLKTNHKQNTGKKSVKWLLCFNRQLFCVKLHLSKIFITHSPFTDVHAVYYCFLKASNLLIFFFNFQKHKCPLLLNFISLESIEFRSLLSEHVWWHSNLVRLFWSPCVFVSLQEPDLVFGKTRFLFYKAGREKKC